MNYILLRMLLSMFLTSTIGVIVYCGMFSYSFKRRKLFWLRIALSLLASVGISAGIACGIFYDFTHGVETSLGNIEYMRMASNGLSLLVGITALFICFNEKPVSILFATVMGYSGNGIASSAYAAFIDATRLDSIYFSEYRGYSALSFVLFFAVHLVVFLILFFTCARAFAKSVKTVDKKIGKSIIVFFAFFTWITMAIQGSNVFNSVYNGATLEAVSFTFNGIVVFIYVIIVFSLRYILVWAHTSQEKEAEKAFYDSYKEKVELQERNVELINLKCHDMKHQLRALLESKNLDVDFIEETQKAISIYDAQVKTGNDTLDALLTQKSLVCEANDILLTVMLDGEALSFMSVQEINSFFGNALDNAVDYLLTVEKEKRFIRISSAQNGSIFTIRVENYCETPVAFHKNGLPQSTKEDNGYHGFGTKSIKSIAQKHGGDATFDRRDDMFILTAVFMI